MENRGNRGMPVCISFTTASVVRVTVLRMIIFSQFWEHRSRNLPLLLYIYYLHISWSVTINNDETMLIYLDHCFKSVYISIQPALQFFLRYSTLLIVHSCSCFQQLVLKLVDLILLFYKKSYFSDKVSLLQTYSFYLFRKRAKT